jgi:hypothetical protein
MDLSPIFVDKISGEGLYSIKYGRIPEYTRLLKLWTNTLYVTEYCEKNRSCFMADYFKGISIDEVISKVIREARQFSNLLRSYAESGFDKTGHLLQELFKPLDDFESHLYVHQESKGFIIDKYSRIKPILRLYAVRIGSNTYVISGGAIKLVHKMKDHTDTLIERDKLKKTKQYLIEQGYTIEEDLKIIL